MNFENMDEREKFIGRKPCCEQDFGGSHYHCGRCNGVTGMMGHSTVFCKVTGERTLHHQCCPGNCALDDVEEIEEELAFWLNLEKKNDADYSFTTADIQKKLNYARRRREG